MVTESGTLDKSLPHSSPRGEATATVVASVLGLSAFAVSFTHVQTVAMGSGQGGWAADAIAASVELMATAAITEIRRRRRRNQPTGWPRGVLVLGVAMSLASNLATATPTVWGCIMAAWPQVAFLAVAALIETRPEPVRPEPVRPEPVQPEPVQPEPVQPEPVQPEPVRRRGAPGSSEMGNDPRTARTSGRLISDGSKAGSAGSGARPSRATVVAELCTEITADAAWKPDYAQLAGTTGYGLSWLEKRVAEARHAVQDARRQPHAEAIRTEPPVPTQPDVHEYQGDELASVTEIPKRRPVKSAEAAPLRIPQSSARRRPQSVEETPA